MPLDFKNLSILVVEDTLPMQRLIVSVLESLGFTKVLVANNGLEGYRSFRQHNPDIVITDWMMTPENGLDLTKKIRTDITSPNKMTPVILITGYSSLPRVNEARDMGVTEFLVKPFTANDVAKRLAHVINFPRDFIVMREFFGPDRRRKRGDQYAGPRKRASDRVADRAKNEDDGFFLAFRDR